MSSQPVTPEIFTADYIGEPGKRRFFLQARGGVESQSYLIEKEQVAALAERLREMLVLIDQDDTIRAAMPARDPALAVQTLDDAAWRVTTIGLGYEEGSDHIVVLLQESTPADASGLSAALGLGADPELGDASEPGDAPQEEVREATYLLRRDQVRAFVLHAVAVVAEGRPICQLCGLPMDPEGHLCPASNGHHPTV